MTLFHVQFAAVQPSRGDRLHKVVAYNSASRIVDHDGSRYDFTRKAREHAGGCLMLPPGSPAWARDPAGLWGRAEAAETRIDGQPARLVEIAIPREVRPADRMAFARAIAAPWCAEGAAVQVDIHCPPAADGEEQPHVHYILSRRALGPSGFAKKKLSNQPWTADKGRVMRAEIADRMNRWLEARDYESRVDHRRHAEQGDPTPPERNVSRRAVEAYKRDPDAAHAYARVLSERPRRRARRAELAAARTEMQAAGREVRAAEAAVEASRRTGPPGTVPRRRRNVPPPPAPAWATEVRRERGAFVLVLAGGGAVIDRGHRGLYLRGQVDRQALAALADRAAAQGYASVVLTGDPAHHAALRDALRRRGIDVVVTPTAPAHAAAPAAPAASPPLPPPPQPAPEPEPTPSAGPQPPGYRPSWVQGPRPTPTRR